MGVGFDVAGVPTVTGTPPSISPVVLGAGETIWDYAIKHGCWICARHGLTGKLQPVNQSKFFLTMKFHPMSAEAAITDFEKHVSFVTAYGIEKSINRSQAAALIASPDLKDRLYHVIRFFEFPIPHWIDKDKGLWDTLKPGLHLNNAKGDYGKKAYFCGPDLEPDLDFDSAKKLIDYIFDKFDFDPAHEEQSRTHAIARLITPYCQALMGPNAKTPLWIFQANRSRAGKDYCAAITPLVYTGIAYEDAPLDEDDSENKRRITAAIISGQKYMHFANCKTDLDECKNLEAAVTAKFWKDRVVGTSEEISMPNEIIYSLSYNGNLELSDDLANRTRRIKFYIPKDKSANSRGFTDLHGFLGAESRRRKVISAIHALVVNWIKGSPKHKPMQDGSVVFTSFPEWAKVVGGIMEAAGYQNPCKPDLEDKKSVKSGWEEDIPRLADIISKNKPDTALEMAEIVDNYVKKDPDLNDTMTTDYRTEDAYKHELGQRFKKASGKNLGGGLMIERVSRGNSKPKYKFHPAKEVETKYADPNETKPPFLTDEEYKILKRPDAPPIFDPFDL